MSDRRCALVTGASGQDGTYLTRELAANGYRVVGAVHRPVYDTVDVPFEVIDLDITDTAAVGDTIRQTAPDVIFNLAALSSGRGMFDDPVGIADVNGVAVTRLLEGMRTHCPTARLCHASSSEIFGLPGASPQSEATPPSPRSPYGAAKLYADGMIQIYRRSFGLFACSAILFNHESPLRRDEFVTRKITLAAARIKLGLQRSVPLGQLDARRDWGFAGDYMRAMRLMVEQPMPRDYVLASGRTHSVRELCEIAFGHVGLDYRDHVDSDSASERPAETMQLVGDASRARSELGWEPRVDFVTLIRLMVDADLSLLNHPPPPEEKE